MAGHMEFGLEKASVLSVRQLAQRVGKFNANNRVENSTVCVTGPVGVGKSSFIITVASALAGQLEIVAGAGNGTESFTRESYDHVLEYEDGHCSWKIRDTPGDLFDELVDSFATRLPPGEIQNRLKSRLAPALLNMFDLNEEQVLKAAYKGQVEKETVAALLEEGTGCVMVLLSVRTFGDCAAMENSHWTVHENSLMDLQLKALKFLHMKLSAHGTRVLCALTQADQLDDAVARDVANVQGSEVVRCMRQCVHTKAGLPLNQVFPSVNLADRSEPSQNHALCHLALCNMHLALNTAKCSSKKLPRAPQSDSRSISDHIATPSPLKAPKPPPEPVWNVPEVEVNVQALDTPPHVVEVFKSDLNEMLRRSGRSVKVAWVHRPTKWNLLLHMPSGRLLPSRVLNHLRRSRTGAGGNNASTTWVVYLLQHTPNATSPPPSAEEMTSEGGLKELKASVGGSVEWYRAPFWCKARDGIEEWLQEVNAPAAAKLADEVEMLKCSIRWGAL